MSSIEEKDFQKEHFDASVWRKILTIMFENKKEMIGLMVFNFGIAVTEIAFPLLNREAINRYVSVTGHYETLPVFIVIYLIAIVLKCMALYFFFTFAGKVESGFGKNLRQKCFVHLQELSFPYFDRTANGWLMARISSDTGRLAETLAWSFIDIIWGSCTIIGIATIMIVINWKMALAVLFIVPFLWFVSLSFQKRILKAQRQSRKANSKITAAFSESISGAQTTKTLAVEEKNYRDFKMKTSDMEHASLRAIHLNGLFQPLIFLMLSIVLASLLTIGGKQVLLATIEFGTLALFVNYAEQFFDPLKQLARIMSEMQLAQANAERILSLIEEKIEITDREDVIEKYGTLLEPKLENYEELHGEIEFKHVDFSYNEREKVLSDFNLHVNQGEMVALVGETGSGKSTIVNLLCRFYEPTDGEILIDGVNYQDRSVAWLHSNIGYVLQTPCLFSGTIKENIRYGRSDASDEEVEAVAKLIHADEFIMRMEKGYDSEVGEGGDLLSTGEKQLISFARALISNPAIVILDEATSSIDTESERNIQHAIEKLLEKRTSFVVAHRLSTIVKADQILVMDHGRVIEHGSHDELMKQKGSYFELFTSQSIQERAESLLK